MKSSKLSRMPRFIHFFGPDGSGKSTHARILANHLKRNGIKVKVVWIKSHHTFSFIILKILTKITPSPIDFNSNELITQIRAISNSLLGRSIWSLIEFVSIMPCIILHVYLPLAMGRVIVAERYVVDSVVSIAYSVDDPNFTTGFIARLLLRFIPKDSLLFHLDSTYEETMRRRGLNADPEEYIRFQRNMYGMLSKSLSALTINTSRLSIEKTAELIVAHTSS